MDELDSKITEQSVPLQLSGASSSSTVTASKLNPNAERYFPSRYTAAGETPSSGSSLPSEHPPPGTYVPQDWQQNRANRNSDLHSEPFSMSLGSSGNHTSRFADSRSAGRGAASSYPPGPLTGPGKSGFKGRSSRGPYREVGIRQEPNPRLPLRTFPWDPAQDDTSKKSYLPLTEGQERVNVVREKSPFGSEHPKHVSAQAFTRQQKMRSLPSQAQPEAGVRREWDSRDEEDTPTQTHYEPITGTQTGLDGHMGAQFLGLGDVPKRFTF